MARSVEDVALGRDVLTGAPQPADLKARAPRRIGLCRTYLWNKASAETKEAVESAAARLAAAGVQVEEVSLPEEFGGLTQARDVINNIERVHGMAHEWHRHRDQLSVQLSRCIALGLETPQRDYVAALRLAERCRIKLDAMMDGFDLLVAPSATGEAPLGLEWTGDSTFQGLWTLLHVPTVSLPVHAGPNGLPVGVQLIGPRFGDEKLLQAASWIFATLGTPRRAAPALVA
jgi:Asp-tRNA(Asn)/Glu-tRNA(Gln) amidotransferase A subunit family amidase